MKDEVTTGMKMIVDGEGELPPDLMALAQDLGAEIERGPIVACDICQHFSCVCEIRRLHKEGCRYRRAATCAVPISCEPHDRDVCPECDSCSCGAT